jgi:hypothetical protein
VDFLTVNLKGKVREETLHGRNYLVVPGTLINPGVLPGNKGPLFYPPDEVAKEVHIWNGVPIVGYHPTVNGVHVSARDPSVLAQQGLGFVFNTFFDKKLKTEYWFDEELTAAFDEALPAGVRIIPRLKKGTAIETSTGLFTTNTLAPEGSFYNGAEYHGIATNYRPDHVAVLPDGPKGACGIKDGCGVLVNEAKDKEVGLLERIGKALGIFSSPTVNELSHEDLRQALSQALRSRFTQSDPSCYVCEVYDDYFIYEQGSYSYQIDYTKSETGVELGTDPQPVIREVNYVPVPKGENMALTANERKSKVDFLVTNCTCWKNPKDVAVLNSMSDEQLQQIEAAAKATTPPPAPVSTPTPPAPEPALFTEEVMDRLAGIVAKKLQSPVPTAPVVPAPVAAVVPVAQPITTNEWLASIPADIRVAVQNSLGIVNDKKTTLVQQLVSNVQDETQRKAHVDRLMQKDVPELEFLVSLNPPTQQLGGGPLFIGNGGAPVVNQGEEDTDVVVPPTIEYKPIVRARRPA